MTDEPSPPGIRADSIEAADGYMGKGDFRRALTCYELILASEPGNSAAQIGRAAALLSLGAAKQGGEVLRTIGQAHLADPLLRARHTFWTADWLARSDRPEDAVRVIDEALPTTPREMAGRMNMLAARALLQLKRPDQARERVRQAWQVLDRQSRSDLVWMSNTALFVQANAEAASAARLVLSQRFDIGMVYVLLFALLGGLPILARMALFLGLVVLLLGPTLGWLVLAGLTVWFLLGAIVGWRAKLGSVAVGSIGVVGLLLLAMGLVAAYRWIQVLRAA